MSNNIVTQNDLNQTSFNPFEWSGAVIRGKPWLLPDASQLPEIPDGVGYGCFVNANLGVGLPLFSVSATASNDTTYLYCKDGYFCPYIDPIKNPYSKQVMCPTTTRCAIERLTGKHCLAQGRYEPMLCWPGFYCPTPKSIEVW